jgi:hypothetical protein
MRLMAQSPPVNLFHPGKDLGPGIVSQEFRHCLSVDLRGFPPKMVSVDNLGLKLGDYVQEWSAKPHSYASTSGGDRSQKRRLG